MAHIKKLYEDDFDGKTFAETYIGGEEVEHKWTAEDFYHRLFQEGKLRGKTFIDVGCGPTFRGALFASRHDCDVYCADYLEKNHNLVKNWLRKGHEVVDFTAQFKHVAQLENKTDIEYLEDRVRKCVKEVLFCDILADNPLHPRPLQQFDIVVTSYCLDSYPDEVDYLKGAKGIANLVRPGGYLAFVSSMGGTYYTIGDKTLPCPTVTGEYAKKALIKAGLKVLEVCEYHAKEPLPWATDVNGFVTVYAMKPE